jgi:hypothetical protein
MMVKVWNIFCPTFQNANKNRIPTFLRWILKYDEVKAGDAVPALVFPEGASTSGTSGLLKFRCVGI